MTSNAQSPGAPRPRRRPVSDTGDVSDEQPLRADAQRNREKLLDAARKRFASDGGPGSLDGIAKAAGVGIGTLYRHFPTREALVEAVYAGELETLATSADALAQSESPEIAMRKWMSRYLDFVTTKRGMIDTLRAGWASGRIAAPATRERITAAIATILTAGVRSHAFRDDIEADDVTALILGVSLSIAPGAPEQADRLFDLVVDALRPRR